MPVTSAGIILLAALSAVMPGRMAWAQAGAGPQGPDPICAKFQRTDRKWCALQRVKIEGLNGSVEIAPGACFDRNEAWFFGTNVARDLNRRCPN